VQVSLCRLRVKLNCFPEAVIVPGKRAIFNNRVSDMIQNTDVLIQELITTTKKAAVNASSRSLPF